MVLDTAKPWTTPKRASIAASAAKDVLIKRLRSHAERLVAAADGLQRPKGTGKDYISPGVFGLAPVEELRIALLSVVSDSVDDDICRIEERHGGYPIPTSKAEGARAEAERMLKAFDAYAGTAKSKEDAVAVDDEAAGIMRRIVGRHLDGTVHVGDSVEWQDGEVRFRGRVINIHQGTCVIARVSRLVRHGSSSERGVKLVPVGDVEPEPVDYY